RTLGLKQIWDAYYAGLKAHPETVAVLTAQVLDYDADLRALGLEDHELDRSPAGARPLRVLSLVAQLVFVFMLLPPLLVFGLVVNRTAAIALLGASRIFARRKKDVATIKLLLGALLVPSSWGLAGWLAYRGSETIYRLDPTLPDAPGAAAMAVILLGAIGGMAALRYLRLV